MPDSVCPRVLVIDDDRMFLEIVHYHLDRAGYEVEIAADPHEGLDRAIEKDFQLIILDLMMPGMNGEEVLSLLKPMSLQHRVLVVSGHTGNEYRSRVRDLGSSAYLQKPIDPAELLTVADELVRRPVEQSSDSVSAQGSVAALDRLSIWIFEGKDPTKGKRIASVVIPVCLLSVLAWLLFS